MFVAESDSLLECLGYLESEVVEQRRVIGDVYSQLDRLLTGDKAQTITAESVVINTDVSVEGELKVDRVRESPEAMDEVETSPFRDQMDRVRRQVRRRAAKC